MTACAAYRASDQKEFCHRTMSARSRTAAGSREHGRPRAVPEVFSAIPHQQASAQSHLHTVFSVFPRKCVPSHFHPSLLSHPCCLLPDHIFGLLFSMQTLASLEPRQTASAADCCCVVAASLLRRCCVVAASLLRCCCWLLRRCCVVAAFRVQFSVISACVLCHSGH